MKTAFLLSAAAVLALSACGDKKSETATTTQTAATDATNSVATGVSDVGQTPAANAVQDTVGAVAGAISAPMVNSAEGFVRNAALSDMYEIESSKLAVEKAKSKAVRDFANMMIKQHTATSAELKTVATVAPPTALDPRRQGFIDNLRAADAGSFDRVYVNQQTAAHSETQTMLQSFIDDGNNAQLKAFAQKTLPKVEQHLRMVKQIDAAGANGNQG